MAYAKGVEAVIKIGSDTLSQVTNWSLDVTQDTVEVSNIGNTVKTFETTMSGWTATVDLFYDEADTAQGAIKTAAGIPAGAQGSVTANFYYEGTASGVDKYLYGSAYVTGFSVSQEANGVATASISLQGTGALTEGTAS
tara:strand:+ start:549 stop:965 length:417 start_codon:yes stop_codon:yes gene_type:complete